MTHYKMLSVAHRVFRHLGLRTTSARVDEILSAIDQEILIPGNIKTVVQALDASRNALFRCFRNHHESSAIAKLLTVKVLNLCISKHHFLSRSTSLVSRPFGLILDPTNVCNLACPGCVHSNVAKEHSLFQWKPGALSADRSGRFLEQYGPYAIQVMFYNYGEPLLNPETPKFIRRAKSYLAQTMLSTNMSVPRFDAEAYVGSGLDYVILSIDGATQPVYERFRKKGNIELVYRNIAKLVEAKRKLGKRTPVICWQYLAFEHNAHEVPLALERAGDLGLDAFNLLTPFDVSWDDPGIQPAEIEPFARYFNPDPERDMTENWNPFPADLDVQTIEREFEAGWAARLARQPAEDREPAATSEHTCRRLYKNITIDANGRIFPCCGAPGPKGDLIFSNFEANNSQENFNSEKYRRARQFFADRNAYQRERDPRSGDGEPYCVDCQWSDGQADIDSAQVAFYLRAAGNGLFSAKSAAMLSV
jgi:MoaA/NifB/PqqE/SkfB family radical SAM enzyme